MRKIRVSAIGALLILGLLAAACGGDTAETTTSTTAAATTTTAADTTTTAAAGAGELLVWSDATRAPVIEGIAPAFTEATGVEVVVEILDFGQIRDQAGVAGPAGEGPDILIGAHDWTGQLAVDGVVDPIDLGAKSSEFFDVALTAFSFEGDLYAVPYATEAIAMYYNIDLVGEEAPTTFEEVIAICEGLEGLENCVGVTGGADAGDAYHNYPFLSALGGYIFRYDPETGYDPSDVGLDNEGAIAGISFLEELADSGIVAPVNYDGAKNLFLEGVQPFWLTGPWELASLQDQDAVNWGVAKLPTIEGNTPQPFVGAQGFFISAFSENKVLAQSFLLDFIATEDTMRALYEADPRNPAMISLFEELSSDPVVATFTSSAADGVPMPNIPEMGSVWGPLGENILLVRTGQLSAEEAMTTAAEAVRAEVEG